MAASTDVGLVKDTNQDSYCAQIISTRLGRMVFAVLCDGMGGLSKGEVASATVVSAYRKWAENRLPELCTAELSDADIRADWVGIAEEYNEKIKQYGKKCAVNLGTTATVLLITESRYYILNVGDTRAYEIDGGVRCLTSDQTVVAREIFLGNLTEEQAKNDPRRSVLLQCIGASDSVYPDLFFGDTRRNAVYLLCSDGFRHEISEQEIYDVLNPAVLADAGEIKNGIDNLIVRNKQRLEKDNISAIAVKTI